MPGKHTIIHKIWGRDMKNFVLSILFLFLFISLSIAGSVGVMRYQSGSRVSVIGLDASGNASIVGNVGITGDLVVNETDLFVDESTGRVGVGTATPAGIFQVFGGTSVGIGTLTPATTLEVAGVIKGTQIAVGATAPAATLGLQIGPGTGTAGPTISNNSALIKGDFQVDETIYNPGIAGSGNYVCFNSTTKDFYRGSSCP